MYKFSPLDNAQEEIRKESALLKLVFGKKHFTEKFLQWEYIDNPDGKAVGFNAYSSTGKLAGHYVTQPMSGFLFGKEAKGLLSLNTATHPDHQGKGLFTELAQRTYDHAKELGYEFVIGVANQNSTHGFISKLGFQLAGKLSAIISKGNFSDTVYPGSNAEFDFIRNWNDRSLQWRIANPEFTYGIHKKNDHAEVFADSGKAGIKVLLGSFEKSVFPLKKSVNEIKKPLTLLLGTAAATKVKLSAKVPDFLRPSPLNLIFKDLSGKNRTISFKKTFFTAIDFDAY